MPSDRRLTYHDVVKTALAQGVGAVVDLKGKPSRRVFGRACEELRRLGQPQLADEVESQFMGDGVRGQPPPGPGTERTYKTQTHNGTDYIRLPVGPIKLMKGKDARVSFAEDGDSIVVTRAST